MIDFGWRRANLPAMDTSLSLTEREGLPEALRVLLQDYPRDGWQSHPNFQGLVSFWLDRHLMFRRLSAALLEDVEERMDGKLAQDVYVSRLGRFGNMLVQQLHGHHQIEDHHYFPVLVQRDTRLERGFEILDRDHHDLDGLLGRFTQQANAVLKGGEFGPFREEVLSFGKFLERHLSDEEDLIVPVILRDGPQSLE